MQKTDGEFLTEHTLAERWQISLRTLQGWRISGKGPQFLKIGQAVRYPVDAVRKFEEDSLRRSTSDVV